MDDGNFRLNNVFSNDRNRIPFTEVHDSSLYFYAICRIRIRLRTIFRKFNFGILLILYVVSLSVTGSDKAKRGIYHSFSHEYVENRIRW